MALRYVPSGGLANVSSSLSALPRQEEAVARVAIYFAPAKGSQLAELAAAWFDNPRVAEITGSPRLYGFHATLKAPFRLAEGSDLTRLLGTAERFAAARRWVEGPPLQVAALGEFLALVPATADRRVDALASDCVQAFEPFRAPLNDSELAKRRSANLSARQEGYLRDWGYPYVMEEFRFHMTLTERLDDTRRAQWKAELERHFAPIAGQPLLLDAISVFVQDGQDAPFRHYARIPFEAR